MSDTTPIHYADGTCNPIMGCDGCELWTPDGRRSCYAGVQHETFGAYRQGYSPTFDQITYWPGRMAKAAKLSDRRGCCRPEKPWLDGLPRLIFVSDMGDALCKAVPFEFLRMEIIDNVVSADGCRHIWLWVTKRPARMAEFSAWLSAQNVPWPGNLWAATTITTAETMVRIDELLKVGTEKTVHCLSVEPQLERLDLRRWLPRLHWVLQGGESGNDQGGESDKAPRKFDIAWAAEMHEHCKEAGTPYFLKQLGACVFRGKYRIPRLQDSHHGSDWSEWPDDVPKIRQMPTPRREVYSPA